MGGLTGTPAGEVTITPVYWAPAPYAYSANYKTIINTYVANVAADSLKNTNVFSVGTQYYQQMAAAGSPIQHITYVVHAGAAIDDNNVFPAGCTPATTYTDCVTDAEVRTELQALLIANSRPMDDAHMYMVLFPPAVETCTTAAKTACSSNVYCAYHSGFPVGPPPSNAVLYGNQPYPVLAHCTDPGNGPQAPNGDAFADAELSAFSHEANETITDYAGAWYDATGNENGDECVGTFGTPLGGIAGSFYNQVINGAHYYTQDEFSNEDFAHGVGDVNHVGGSVVLGCVQQDELPTAAFTNAAPVIAGSSTSFDGTASSDPDNATALSYSWNWGDGTANSTGATPSHVFAAGGNYTVTLTVQDVDGWIGTVSHLISAVCALGGGPNVGGISPSSGFTSGGTLVTISGCAFTGATGVSFGGTAAAGFMVISDNQIQATSPVAAAGIVHVTVTTPSGTSTTSTADQFTYTIPPCASAGLSPDKASPQIVGTTVTFTATSTACPNPEYLFYLQAPGGPWTVVQGYGGPTFVWHTSGLAVGTYSVNVWVRQVGSGVPQQDAHTISYMLSPIPACTSAGLNPDKGSPQVIGMTITFTATSATCPNPEYLFYLQAPGASWMLVQAYGGPTFVWHTGGLAAGTYNVDVWVRQVGSGVSYQDFHVVSYMLALAPGCTGAGLNPDKGSPQVVGTMVTFTATSATCANPEYLFYVQPPGGSWMVAQSYGGPTFVWNTVGLATGAYNIDVWVRQVGSGVPYQDIHLIPYTLSPTPGCTGAGINPDKASPQQTGTFVTFIASSATCLNPEYQFYVQAPGGSWTIAQVYGGPLFFWNTAGRAAGTYNVDVWVRQVGSGASYQDFHLTNYTLGAAVPCATGGVSPDKTSPQQTGTVVTFTGTSAGCSQPQYLFYIQAPGGSWTLARGYDESTFAWNTGGLSSGTYKVDVWVRQNGSLASEETFQVIGYTLGPAMACAAAGLAPDKASPQPVGTTITFTATSTTCSQPTYLFYLKSPSGAWSVVQGYSSVINFVWNTSGLAPGTYSVDVWVRQNGSVAPYETILLVTFTLT